MVCQGRCSTTTANLNGGPKVTDADVPPVARESLHKHILRLHVRVYDACRMNVLQPEQHLQHGTADQQWSRARGLHHRRKIGAREILHKIKVQRCNEEGITDGDNPRMPEHVAEHGFLNGVLRVLELLGHQRQAAPGSLEHNTVGAFTQHLAQLVQGGGFTKHSFALTKILSTLG
jgi:hypothetical protein